MRNAWIVVVLAACGNSSEPLVDAAHVIDSALDAGDDAASDAPADAAGCGVLPGDPTDVFVDKSSTAASIGTASCPFHSIAEALAPPAPTPANPRQVRVTGGVPAVSYVEPVLLVVPPHATLAGDGTARVIISGGAPCAVTVAPACTISLAGGGTLRDVTVTSATGNAVEVGAGSGPARIQRVRAELAKHNGFAVRADVVLDQVAAIDNQLDGVDARTANITITAAEIRLNDGHGLDIDQGATLTLTGAMIHNNRGDGVFLHNGSQFMALAHAITNADIQQNLFAGIDVAANASLVLRGTKLFRNEFGVLFSVGTTNKLDIGTAAQPGNNIFAGVTAVSSNIRAGVCMENTGATATQVLEGNTWRVCPPPQRKITGPFCVSNNVYSDVAYVPAVSTSGAPAIPPAACTVGP